MFLGFPGGSAGKESACNAGDLGSIPRLGRSPGERKGYPLQYSGWENSTDSPWGHKESDTTGRLSLSLSTFLLQCMKVESEREVAQSCLTLRDPMDCSPPGSSIHGIFQARVLEWGAIAFSEAMRQKSSNTRVALL